MGPLSQQVIMADTTEEEKKMVEMFRLKRLIQNLESARGNGTSMITLIAPPGDQISQLTRLLTDEQGSASNIKSRVNRLSVLSAITSALQRLKQMSSVPENGLALFTGNVVLSDGKEKKVTYVIEPHRPLNTSLYMCDSRFHVDALRDLLSNDDSFGFIIVDGNGVLYGKLTGNHKETLHKFTVELPKKHGRGGQSAVRFARLRMEARHNYVRKVAEHAVKHFITNDRPNVQGIILAGSADFKNELAKSDLFDPRLLEVVIKTIELSAESLANVALVKEKKLLAEYFEHIALDTNKILRNQGHHDGPRNGRRRDPHHLGRPRDRPHRPRRPCFRLGNHQVPQQGAAGGPHPVPGQGNRRRPRAQGARGAHRVACKQLLKLWRLAQVCHRPFPGGLSVLQGLWWCRRHPPLPARLCSHGVPFLGLGLGL